MNLIKKILRMEQNTDEMTPEQLELHEEQQRIDEEIQMIRLRKERDLRQL